MPQQLVMFPTSGGEASRYHAPQMFDTADAFVEWFFNWLENPQSARIVMFGKRDKKIPTDGDKLIRILVEDSSFGYLEYIDCDNLPGEPVTCRVMWSANP